jgi:uncharacterized repeat protein (TIGR01451 family)
MNKLTIGASSAVITVVAAVAISAPAFAWHPKGTIIKKVQNTTTNSALSDANDNGSAIAAKPGDILRYVVEVRNDAEAADKNYNDMAGTIMTDDLPAGVELVDTPSVRKMSFELGTLKPGQKIVKEFTVKVTANQAGVISNKACFTGDSAANDNPQKGCDTAVVKVDVPKPTPTPTPKPSTTPTPKPSATPTPKVTPTPSTTPTPVASVTPAPSVTPTPKAPEALPETGTADVVKVGLLVSIAGYAAHMLISKRR